MSRSSPKMNRSSLQDEELTSLAEKLEEQQKTLEEAAKEAYRAGEKAGFPEEETCKTAGYAGRAAVCAG